MFSHPLVEASSPDSETPLVQPEQIDNISCSEHYEVMFLPYGWFDVKFLGNQPNIPVIMRLCLALK